MGGGGAIVAILGKNEQLKVVAVLTHHRQPILAMSITTQGSKMFGHDCFSADT